jgi:hypothetical protein
VGWGVPETEKGEKGKRHRGQSFSDSPREAGSGEQARPAYRSISYLLPQLKMRF